MTNKQPVLIPPGGGRRISVGAATLLLKLDGESSTNAATVTEYILPAGFPGPPPHKHRVFEHAWYVLEGSVGVVLDRERQELLQGSFLFIPKHTVHAFANNSGAEARLLAVDLPGGFEKYYDDLQEAFGGRRPIDQQVMREIQLKYDTYPPEYDFETLPR